ncbi:MAG TPA: hypothetical protein VMF30_07740 [Pirellulales bacterium]|nr:hypothetical protein [Pirellulales bacterium]
MAHHAHPSRHGRLILRSLVDALPAAEPAADAEQGAAEATIADSPANLAVNRRVHPGQGSPAPLGVTPVRSDGPRVPSVTPAVLPRGVHAGQGERSIKPPRMATGGRDASRSGNRANRP